MFRIFQQARQVCARHKKNPLWLYILPKLRYCRPRKGASEFFVSIPAGNGTSIWYNVHNKEGPILLVERAKCTAGQCNMCFVWKIIEEIRQPQSQKYGR